MGVGDLVDTYGNPPDATITYHRASGDSEGSLAERFAGGYDCWGSGSSRAHRRATLPGGASLSPSADLKFA